MLLLLLCLPLAIPAGAAAAAAATATARWLLRRVESALEVLLAGLLGRLL